MRLRSVTAFKVNGSKSVGIESHCASSPLAHRSQRSCRKRVVMRSIVYAPDEEKADELSSTP